MEKKSGLCLAMVLTASVRASFNPAYLIMAHKGIVIAVPHVRGGGEKELAPWPVINKASPTPGKI